MSVNLRVGPEIVGSLEVATRELLDQHAYDYDHLPDPQTRIHMNIDLGFTDPTYLALHTSRTENNDVSRVWAVSKQLGLITSGQNLRSMIYEDGRFIPATGRNFEARDHYALTYAKEAVGRLSLALFAPGQSNPEITGFHYHPMSVLTTL